MIKNIAIDECISPQAADALKAFLALGKGAGLRVEHVRRDLKFGSRPDEEWLRTLRPATAWLVITCDYGSRNAGFPLPKAASMRNIPVLWLYGKLGERAMLERVRALLLMWPDIERLVLPLTNGRRWRILCRARSGYRLDAWPEKQSQRELSFMRASADVGDRRRERGEQVRR